MEPSILIGLCLPTACRMNNLESLVNNVIQNNVNNAEAKIPQEMCQFEERDTNRTILDYITL